MDKKDLCKYEEGINKTGFILEYKVTKILESHNWNIINSRYYIDEQMGCEREIDIIAYKAKVIDDIEYYTTLIISCKKSAEDLWAFLTKDINRKDPNMQLYPVSNWTNNKIIKYMLKQKELGQELENLFDKKPFLNSIYNIEKQVFAFQQLSISKCSPKNDKNIYQSIITSIKAQEYEIRSLRKRKKTNSFYNFNILSIFEGTMLEFYYKEEKPSIQEITDIRYLNRHIVNNVENYYRVDFTTYDNFERRLESYDELFKWNMGYYSKLVDEYYIKLFEVEKALDVFIEDFQKDLLDIINLYVDMKFGECEKINKILLSYDSESTVLMIDLNFSSNIIKYLNSEDEVLEIIRCALKKWYRYEGDFVIDVGIPF